MLATLPEKLPVMTLANTVLLPQTAMPLYIFENRYRRMLADALAGDRVFAVANAAAEGAGKGVEQPACEFATVGLIRMSSLSADGTSTLILHGSARVRIEEILSDSPYRVARVRQVPSVYDPTDPSNTAYRQTLLALIEQLNALAECPTGEFYAACASYEDVEELTHFAMQTYCSIPQINQRILETLDFRRRFEIALQFFQQQIAAIQLKNGLGGWSGDPADAGPFDN